MRERLTLAFVGLALVIGSVTGLVRAVALGDLTRTSEMDHLTHDAQVVARVVETRSNRGEDVDAAHLDGFASPLTRVSVQRRGVEPIVVDGQGFANEPDGDNPAVRETVGETTVTIVQAERVVDELIDQKRGSLLALMGMLLVLAALLAFGVATLLARPFQRLAESAAALGRGRFDIEPPRSRIPEVASIAESLRASAGQLQDSLTRDREFFHHASHVLRTPMTGLRLELEELTGREDLDPDARRTAGRCLADVQRLDTMIAELLDFARGRQLVAGAEVSLLALGSNVAQRWRDTLPDSREVKAFVDRGPEVKLTPGPVEQLLDSVLRDVREHGDGPVTLRFAGEEEHVKVTVLGGPRSRPGDTAGEREAASSARTIAEVLGGRYVADPESGQLEILLPRR